MPNFVGSSSPAAVAGYPDLTVPAGLVRGGTLPIGVSFFAGRWSEDRLIELGFAFEQASHARKPPRFIPTIGPDPPVSTSPALPAPATVPVDPLGELFTPRIGIG